MEIETKKQFVIKKKKSFVDANKLVSNIIVNNILSINLKDISFTKPLIKWVGGKTQILNKIFEKFPVEINNYYEIFLGGGSVLFGLLDLINNKQIKITGNIYVFDLNETLINMYKNIQSNYNQLYTELQIIIQEFNSIINNNTTNNDNEIKDDSNQEENLTNDIKQKINRKPSSLDEAKTSKEIYYYWIRNKYNKLSQEQKNSVLGSAIFIFLNKTCFRGVYRVGPNGFNVPYGHYNNPEIINYDNLVNINKLIKNVIFTTSNFKDSISRIGQNDFAYLDPPYAPINSKSFVGYNQDGFTLSNHNELFELCKTLKRKNTKFLMSNSDVELVKNNFPTSEYKTDIIECKRAINSKKPDSKCNEVLISNY
jgi:DNA adenine methylase